MFFSINQLTSLFGILVDTTFKKNKLDSGKHACVTHRRAINHHHHHHHLLHHHHHHHNPILACPFPAILLVSTQSCWAAGFKQDDPAHGFDKKHLANFIPRVGLQGKSRVLRTYLDPYGGGQTPSNPISQHETEWCRFYREWFTKTHKKGQQQCGKYTSTNILVYTCVSRKKTMARIYTPIIPV